MSAFNSTVNRVAFVKVFVITGLPSWIYDNGVRVSVHTDKESESSICRKAAESMELPNWRKLNTCQKIVECLDHEDGCSHTAGIFDATVGIAFSVEVK